MNCVTCTTSVHTQKFENAALFPRLGVPSTLIQHENGAFRNCFSNRRNLKTSGFRYRVNGKHIDNKNLRCHDNRMSALREFSSNTNLWPVFVGFLNSSCVIWTNWSFDAFSNQIKTSISNSFGLVWTWPNISIGMMAITQGCKQDVYIF